MSPYSSSQLTILAIDNQADMLHRIAGVVESAGFCCHCAQDAQTAGEAIRHVTPDLIISDVNLSGQSGLALCEQLKQQAGMCEVPVMYLSSAQGPDIILRADASGGTYYLRKPFDGPILLEMIEKTRLAPHISSV